MNSINACSRSSHSLVMAAFCHELHPSRFAKRRRSSSNLLLFPGRARLGLASCISFADHSESRQNVALAAQRPGSMFASLPAHLHLFFKYACCQQWIPACAASSSAFCVDLFSQGKYSSSGCRRGPALFLSMIRLTVRRAFLCFTVNAHDSLHHSTVFETVASKSCSLLMIYESRLPSKGSNEWYFAQPAAILDSNSTSLFAFNVRFVPSILNPLVLGTIGYLMPSTVKVPFRFREHVVCTMHLSGFNFKPTSPRARPMSRSMTCKAWRDFATSVVSSANKSTEVIIPDMISRKSLNK